MRTICERPIGPVGAVLLLLCIASSAAAQSDRTERRGWSLEWSRSAEANLCPDREALVSALRDHLGRDPFTAEARGRIVVKLSHDDGTWRSKVLRVDDEGNDQGSQQLASTRDDCDELFEATVAALVVMLGHDDDGDDEPTTAEPAAATTPAGEATAPTPPPVAPERSPATATGAEPTPTREVSTAAPAPGRTSPPPSRRNRFGLGVAMDLVYLPSAEGVCSNRAEFDCYELRGEEFSGVADPDLGNSIRGGLVPTTGRILLDYHRRLDDHVGLEARVGFAAARRAQAALPVHLEVGANYWLPSRRRGGEAFLGASLGVAAFDATVPTSLLDCSTVPFPEGDPNCTTSGVNTTVNSVRRTGVAFGGASFGGLLRVHGQSYLLARNSVFVTFPHPVTVIEPTVEYVVAW